MTEDIPIAKRMYVMLFILLITGVACCAHAPRTQATFVNTITVDYDRTWEEKLARANVKGAPLFDAEHFPSKNNGKAKLEFASVQLPDRCPRSDSMCFGDYTCAEAISHLSEMGFRAATADEMLTYLEKFQDVDNLIALGQLVDDPDPTSKWRGYPAFTRSYGDGALHRIGIAWCERGVTSRRARFLGVRAAPEE